MTGGVGVQKGRGAGGRERRGVRSVVDLRLGPRGAMAVLSVLSRAPLPVGAGGEGGKKVKAGGRVKVKYTDGSVYEGRVDADGRRHGRGTLRGADGGVYEGEWAGDVREGRGWLVTGGGLEYTGEFRRDRPEGEGSARYPTGDLYSGGWREGVRHGQGKMVFEGSAPGQWYEGAWAADAPDGEGTLVEGNAAIAGRWDRYEGNFARGVKCGHGMLRTTLAEGDGRSLPAVYVGEFLGGVPHGRGCLEVEGTWRYEGDWRDNVREGEGRCEYTDGSVYEGGWKNDVWEGEGWATSSARVRAMGGDAVPMEYRGAFRGGKEEGNGTARYADGSVYVGEFLAGARHGFGVLKGMPDGRTYEGEWDAGQRTGQGKEVEPQSGRVYMGGFLAGVRHGNGLLREAESGEVLFRGAWEHGSESQRGGCDPRATLVAGPGIHGAQSGVPVSFTVLARDALGNKRLSNKDDIFRVNLVPWDSEDDSVDGEADVLADECISVSKVRQATYQVTYTPRSAGLHRLHVRLVQNGDANVLADVGRSPYAIDVKPGAPDPRRFLVAGPGLAGADEIPSTAVPSVRIALRDGYGNPCFDGMDVCAARMTCFVSLHGDEKGAVHWPVMPPDIHADAMPHELEALHPAGEPALAPGLWRLSVRWDDRDVAGSPFSLSIPHRKGTTPPEGIDVLPVAAKIKDWEAMAMGELIGRHDYDSADDSELEEETQRERNLRVNPDIPLLESAADMHKVRPAKRTKEERAEMRRRKQAFEEYMAALIEFKESQMKAQHAEDAGIHGKADVPHGIESCANNVDESHAGDGTDAAVNTDADSAPADGHY